jgi:tetratricopeptide (TPR) repeat protein
MASRSWLLIQAPALVAAAPLVAVACAPGARVPAPPVIPPPTAEAISLLGDTLWSVNLRPEVAQSRLRALERARRAMASRPDASSSRLAIAKSTAGLGRLREAIDLATEAMERHPDDPRLFRLRGELLLLTRRIDPAIRDLQHAARLTIADSTASEFFEVDDVGLIGLGLRHLTFVLLGQAYYLKGEFARAVETLERALAGARNADEAAAAAVWLGFALQRAGLEPRAAAIAGAWRPDAQVVMRLAEHRLLLAWQGALPSDSLRGAAAAGGGADDEALFHYAAAVRLLSQGQEREATAILDLVRSLGPWTALPFLAAEADLLRLRRRSPTGGRRSRAAAPPGRPFPRPWWR